ncbi:hypothetical protein ACFL27_24095, partial [candidate division CSSED10-310 bacterium]
MIDTNNHRDEFNEQDLIQELKSIKEIHLSLKYTKREHVQNTLNSYLRQEHHHKVLQKFLAKSEDNKVYFLSIIQRFGVEIEIDKHLPHLSEWISQKVLEQKKKIEFELAQCADEKAVTTIMTSLRQNIKDEVFLGYFNYVSKEELLEFFNTIETSEKEKFSNMPIFKERSRQLILLVKRKAAGSDDRASLLAEILPIESDLINLLPHLKDKAILTLIAIHCRLAKKILGWKPASWNDLDETLVFAGNLYDINHFIIDADKLVAERETLFTDQKYQSAWKKIKELLNETERSFRAMVLSQLQPALQRLVDREIIQVPFNKLRNVRWVFEEMITLSQSFENIKSLFSEKFYLELNLKLDKAVAQLKRNVMVFSSQQFEQLPELKELASGKITVHKLLESPPKVSIAKKIAHNLRRKHITPELVQLLFGSPLPKVVLPIHEMMVVLQKNISRFKSSFRNKNDLILDVAYKLVFLIDPESKHFNYYMMKEGQGLRVKLSHRRIKKVHLLRLDWILFQESGPVLLSVKADFFKNQYWIIKLILSFSPGLPAKQKSQLDRAFLDDVQKLFELNVRQFTFSEIREQLKSAPPDDEGVVDQYLSKVHWLETVLTEQELERTEKTIKYIIRTTDAISFLSEFKVIRAPLPQSVIEVLELFTNKSAQLDFDDLEKCLSYFAINNFFFLPTPCRDEETSLQQLINNWISQANSAALDEIFASFMSLVDLLHASYEYTAQEINVSAFSDSERRLFELLKPLTGHRSGKAAFNS